MTEGIGIDIIEVHRIASLKDNQRFLKRCFTPDEIEYCFRKRFPEQSLAARYAAKEAVGKAIGSGVGNSYLPWLDVEVIRSIGKPSIKLHGKMQKALSQPFFLLSLSHTKEYAAAAVIFRCESVDRSIFAKQW